MLNKHSFPISRYASECDQLEVLLYGIGVPFQNKKKKKGTHWGKNFFFLYGVVLQNESNLVTLGM